MKTNIDINSVNDDHFNMLFNSSLINKLPFLFWMYEWIDDGYKLIKWNRNQEIYTEYSSKELYHMSPFDFFKDESKERIKNAIEVVFKKGNVGISEKLITKSGKLIPYFFDAYKLSAGNKKIFIGMSVDVTYENRLKEKLKSLQNEKGKLFGENMKYQEQILDYTYKFFQYIQMTNILDQKIESILKFNNIEKIKTNLIQLRKTIKEQQKVQANWENIKIKFDNIHQDFYTNLKFKHPDLTKGEIQYCTYLKMKILPLEITSLLNISKDGLKKKKYRIRKKMNLKRNESLRLYMETF